MANGNRWLRQVATRRTRTAGKVEIPNVDDHVSKLEHMGKETVKKLQDIHGSALQCGIELSVPTNCINKGARHCGKDMDQYETGRLSCRATCGTCFRCTCKSGYLEHA